MLNYYIDSMKNDIIQSTCQLIQIPSVLTSSTKACEPFGKNCAKALEYTLNLGKSLGFKTKNLDGYCGYIEFGEGPDLIGIIGHLDVVPEGENWEFPPFSGTISNHNIYGRGSIDDKGPVIASLYAMKAVMENCEVKKRVRLILGLDEENEWRCIDYYKKHSEIPSIGFSPDADFPCIYAEKSLLNVHFSQPYTQNNPIKIIHIDCKNNALNVVPKYCSVTLEIDSSIAFDQCVNFFKKYDLQTNIQNNRIQLISIGKAAHAAHPDLGLNAISKLIIVLYEFFKDFNIHLPILSYFYQYIYNEFDGKSLGINFEDESGILTFNVARFYLDNDNLCISSNLRIPIFTPIATIKEKINKLLSHSGITATYSDEKPALFLPKDSLLVTTLCHAFHEITGLPSTPIAIGGATYARAFKHFISFGANMPGNKDMCHQTNEFISIDNLILSSKIYAKAIQELLSL